MMRRDVHLRPGQPPGDVAQPSPAVRPAKLAAAAYKRDLPHYQPSNATLFVTSTRFAVGGCLNAYAQPSLTAVSTRTA